MPKTPKQIVILANGRSFTSVISCMIGQHPDLVGLPETNIFLDPTLGEVSQRFGQRGAAFRRAGLLRTLAQFHDGAQTEETIDAAERFVLEHGDWTSDQVANYIVGLVAPRGIVEKSISTCRSPSTLARVREAWPDAFYLHITRQPESLVRSMASRLENISPAKRNMMRHRVQSQSLEDHVSRLTTTVLSFMATLPPGRGMNLHGENFLSDARLYARQICEWVGLDASVASIEAMLHPENNPFAHQGPSKAPGGMSKTFLENPTFSGQPVTVDPLTIDPHDPAIPPDRRTMALLGHRLGYA